MFSLFQIHYYDTIHHFVKKKIYNLLIKLINLLIKRIKLYKTI